MNSWSLCSHPEAGGHSVTVTAQQAEKAQPGCKETKGKKQLNWIKSFSVQLPSLWTSSPTFYTPEVICEWIQPLIFKTLMFSWPVSALSTHQCFFPLFQSQPSIQSPGSACPLPGEGQSPQAQGGATLPWESFSTVLYVQIPAKRDRPQRGSTKL